MDADTLNALARRMRGSELWSLLLEVTRQRAAARTPATVQHRWENDRFVVPSYIDQRTLMELDGQLLAAAQAFESIELSPLAPLGTCSAMALTTQNRVVSTVRGTEVVSDPTNVLALECARRLRKDPASTIRLATSQRCVRAQQLPDLPGFAAHFRIFCLATAGHELKDQAFVVAALGEHIRTHLAGLDRLEAHGYRFPNRLVKLLATPQREHLAQRIAEGLPDVAVSHEPLTREYYHGLRFMIQAGNAHGADIPLIDGGAFDWLGKLMADRKFVFVASAIGSQLAARLFRPDRPPGA